MISSHNPQHSRYSESVVISYSQNQEDVVLHRLLGVVPQGRYIDVGAGHPVYDNVTYALYLAGWRGINIEPMKREADWLREIRPEDQTFQVALGEDAGRITLFAAPDENRGATTADSNLVQRYELQGQTFEPFEVDVTSLDSILENNDVEPIHVLKIDVEGAEVSVLKGFSIERYMPWVLVIEATRPNSAEDVSSEWEDLVLNAGYVKTLFDGLNNFYVRSDLSEVVELLSIPANVFDKWKPFEVDDLNRQAEVLQKSISEMNARFVSELAERDKAQKAAEEFINSLTARAEKAEIYAKSLQDRLSRETGATFP